MALAHVAESMPADRAEPGALFRRGSWILLSICALGLAIGLVLLSVESGTLRAALNGLLMTVVMYRDQDTIWLAVCVAFSLYLCWSLGRTRAPAPSRLAAFWPAKPELTRFTWSISALVLILVGIGTYLIHHAHDVAIDESLPGLQARIFLSGQLLASAPEEWSAMSRALFPFIFFHDVENGVWGSVYRPVHAAIRAAFSLVSLDTLTNAILTALSVVLIVGVARRLWPDRRDAAILAAVLLATGPQFLFTGMTGFAWPAHLCLNLLWLWLYLRDDRLGHGLAALVGFAAVGLHQINVHPLFVLPFMLSLVWSRRWWLSLFYASTYSAAVLIWSMWHDIAVLLSAGPAVAGGSPGQGQEYVRHTLSLIGLEKLVLQPLMAFNLLRLLAWQNIMILPLIYVAMRRWSSAPQAVRLLAWGCILMMIPYVLMMPNQYYAWGYRYAHGLLGSFALIAAHGWVMLSETGRPVVVIVRRAIIGFTILVLAVGVPLRAVQMESFTRPFAEANRHIHALQTDVVLVDVGKVWFPSTVIRNDPFLADRPLVLSFLYLTPDQLRQVCRDYSVTVIDDEELARLGVVMVDRDYSFTENDEALRQIANGPTCRRT